MVAIVGTPWAKRYLSDEVRAAIAAMVPPTVTRVSLAATLRPGDWSAYLFGQEPDIDPIGVARHVRTLTGAVARAITDMELGAPLAWCSACPAPAAYQRHGEAWCRACEPTRGGTIR